MSKAIYKTVVAISGSPQHEGQLLMMDTIEHEGQMWLVPSWLVPQAGGLSKPERLICLDSLPHQKASMGGSDFVLNNPIPIDILEGRAPRESGFSYLVLECPDIEVAHPRGLH